MSMVQMRTSWELLREMLRLPGDVTVTGVCAERSAYSTALNVIFVLDIPGAPADAVEVTPFYQRDTFAPPDPVRLTGYGWRHADGHTSHIDLTARPA